MPELSDLVPISSVLPFNRDLSSATADTMLSVLGSPQSDLTTSCQNDKASDRVKALEKSGSIGLVKCTGLAPAVDSVLDTLTKAFAAHPELKPALTSAGMLCVRHRKPTSGLPSKMPSNHSWGTAIDFALKGKQPPGATGDQIPYFIALLIPFLNAAGWYSGVGFTHHDDMHFEVADETIRKWSAQGLLGSAPSHPLAQLSKLGSPTKVGADFAIDCTKDAAKIAAKCGVIGRYYRWPDSKYAALTHSEALALSAAGLEVLALWEAASTTIDHFSSVDGVDQGTSAYNQALKAHQTAGSPIYFAVDFDTTSTQVAGPIADYFRGVRTAFNTVGGDHPSFEIGVYGSGRTCSWLLSQGLVTRTWLTNAAKWSGADTFTDWNVKQGMADLGISGLKPGQDGDYDSDEVLDSAGAFKVIA